MVTCFSCIASNKADWQTNGGGDLVHELALQDFHLKLEWKISAKGNSGIIFWVQDDKSKYDHVWFTGPEMQVLDNEGHGDGKIFKHRAGNLYDLIAGPEGVVKPVGEWNKAEIIVQKGTLVRLGQKLGEFIAVNSYELESEVSVNDLQYLKIGTSLNFKQNN